MIKHLRLKISLRVLMLLVLVFGVWLGSQVNKAHEQRAAVAAVKKFGGWVHYDWEFVKGPVTVPPGNFLWTPPWGKLTPGRSPWAPDWVRRGLGDEYFQEIAHVSLFVDIQKGEGHAGPLNIGPADHVFAKLTGQTGIKTLQIGGQQATDDGLRYVGEMTGLEELIIWPARSISDAGVAHLTGLKNLKDLRIDKSKLTDEGLRHLAALRNVEHLSVDGSHFSDTGLNYLKQAKHLKTLYLGAQQNEITSQGREKFKASMPSLQQFE